MSKNNIYLDKILTFLIIFLPIGLLISSGVSETTQILIAIIFIIVSFANKKFYWLKNKYCLLLIFLWISLFINQLFSENFFLSAIRNIFFFKHIIFVFAVIYILKKTNNLNLILTAYLIISGIVALDIFFEFYSKKNILGFTSYDPSRIASFLRQELKIGHFMLAFSFLSISYYFEKYSSKSANYKIFGYFLLVIFFISLLLTGERANSLRGIFIMILFIIFSEKNIFKYKKIFFALIIIISFCTYFFSQNIKNRFDAILLPLKNIGFVETLKETQHGAHYYTAIKIFQKYPFFGVGNKNFREECSKNEYENNNYKKTSQRCSTHPHQIYFELLSEHGLIGTTVIIGVIFFIILKSIKIYQIKKNSIHLTSILFISSQFLPFIPSGSFFISWGATIFWLNFAIIIFYNNKFTTK
jgi:O-antigen ligase